MNFLDSFDVVSLNSATPARLGVALLCLEIQQAEFQTDYYFKADLSIE